MKIIKTTLGWEVRPENKDEESHVRWLIQRINAPWLADGAFIVDQNCPKDTIIPHDDVIKAAQSSGFKQWMEIE